MSEQFNGASRVRSKELDRLRVDLRNFFHVRGLAVDDGGQDIGVNVVPIRVPVETI